jgi:leucyl aminopeptidase
MDDDRRIKQNIKKILTECCSVQKNENILILSDIKQDPYINEKIFEMAKECGANPAIMVMPVSVPGNDLPELINITAMEADLIIATTTTSVYHSAGLRKACREGKARLLTISECNLNTFVEGGISADFKNIEKVVKSVSEKFEKGKNIRYVTPAGTNITADISERPAKMNTGICDKKGMMVGIPTIEVFIAPNEDSINGFIVCDVSCSGGIGIIDEPIHLDVENGKVTKIDGGRQAKQLSELLENEDNSSVYQIAELAIGLNPNCNITGIINEDEGKYGTCHMALGSNASFGGINPAPVHIDMVQNTPTIYIDDEEICRDGRLTFIDYNV